MLQKEQVSARQRFLHSVESVNFVVLKDCSKKCLLNMALLSSPLFSVPPPTTGCKPEQQMMYAGSKNKLVQTAELTKVQLTDQLKEMYFSVFQGKRPSYCWYIIQQDPWVLSQAGLKIVACFPDAEW